MLSSHRYLAHMLARHIALLFFATYDPDSDSTLPLICFLRVANWSTSRECELQRIRVISISGLGKGLQLQLELWRESFFRPRCWPALQPHHHSPNLHPSVFSCSQSIRNVSLSFSPRDHLSGNLRDLLITTSEVQDTWESRFRPLRTTYNNSMS